MSRYKITIEYKDVNGDLHSVSHESTDNDECCDADIAQDLARVLCAVQKLGITVPSPGEQIIAAVTEHIDLHWAYWADPKDHCCHVP